MKCTVGFTDDIFVIVEAEKQDEAIALARVELIKRGDKDWNIHDIKSILWST